MKEVRSNIEKIITGTKKDNRGHEGRTEYLCSKLLSFSTLEQSEYVEYEQGYINQNMGCRSKNFFKSRRRINYFLQTLL